MESDNSSKVVQTSAKVVKELTFRLDCLRYIVFEAHGAVSTVSFTDNSTLSVSMSMFGYLCATRTFPVELAELAIAEACDWVLGHR